MLVNAPVSTVEMPVGADATAPLAGSAARTLLLNASMEPLCIVSLRRAVVLVMTGKATVLESDGRLLHEIGWELPFVPRAPRWSVAFGTTSVRSEPLWSAYIVA